MRYLNKLKIACLDFINRGKIYKKQGVINDSDGLYRFIYSSGHFTKTKKIIKAGGLMPRNGELSTFLCDDLSLEEQLNLSKCKVRNERPKCIGSVRVKDVKAIKLGVCKKEWPHRHKNIIKWTEMNDKAKLKSEAQQLSSVMTGFTLIE